MNTPVQRRQRSASVARISARTQSRFAPRPSRPISRLLGVLLAMHAGCSFALPTGGQTAAGGVTIATPNARTMNVTQTTDKAIVNWSGFSVGRGESVNFAQPAATSMILNRVVGGSYSEILGSISANGQVFLVNPLGVTLGIGAQVDAAGFLASTLAITDKDFLSGRFVFSNPGGAGAVVNQGVINTGSLAALLGPQVRNEGTISARMGTVGLAAGDRVSLDFRGDGLVKFSVDAAAVNANVTNKGLVVAEGGNVVMTAHAANALLDTVINMEGVARATSLSERNGTIVLDGGSSGVVSVTGMLDASGRSAGATGGTVKVLGDKVGLFDGARIDASGDQGGGTVLVGGNWQGKGPEHNASASFFSADAAIAADALTIGKGGTVVVWSDGVTRAGGSITARGGAGGGDGGKVEVSGKGILEFNSSVDTSAPAGALGILLLDPTNLTVNDNASNTRINGDGSGGDPFKPSSANASGSILTWTTIRAGNTNTFVTTVGSADQTGHDGTITITESPDAQNESGSYNETKLLTFTAAGNIAVNASITNSNSGGFTFTAGAGKTVTFAAGAQVTTNGGDINVTGPSGITLGAGFTTGNGNLTLNNPVTLSAANTQISGGTGTVNFVDTVNATASNSQGLSVTLTGAGNLIFGGAVGGGTSLSFVTVTGGLTQINGGAVTTGGASGQSYGAVTLGADTILSAGANPISFGSTLQSATPRTLTLNNTGTTTFGGVVGGGGEPLKSITTNAGGVTAINTTAISTTEIQTYNDAVTLGADTTLTSAGAAALGNITFGGSGNGAQDLTVNTAGTTTFGGVVGGTALTSLTTNAGGTTAINGGAITTTGAQSYGDNVTLGSSATLTAGSLSFGTTGGVETVAVGASSLTLTSNSMAFNGANTVTGSGSITLQQASAGDSVVIGGAAAGGDLNIPDGVLNTFQDGFGSITLGRATGTGTTTVNAVTFRDPTVIRGGDGGTITLAGNVTGTNEASVAFNAGAAGTVNLNFDVTTAAQAVSFTGNVVLGGAGAVRTIDTTGAGNVTFNQTLNGAKELAINNSTGTTTFGGAVGNTTPLAALTTDAGGTTQVNGGGVNATTQTYGDAVVLGAHTTFTGTTGTFTGAIDGGGFNLRLDYSGLTTVDATTFTNVNNFATGGGGTTDLVGTLSVPGSWTFDDAVNLTGATALTSSGNQAIAFNNTVNGAQTLAANTTGTTTFGNAVGGTMPLTSLTTNAGGTTNVAGNVSTDNGQVNFGDNVVLTTGAVVVDAGNAAVTFSGTVNGARALTVNTTGITTFSQAVGGGTPLTSLATNAGGTTNLAANVSTTNGPVNYGDDVVLTTGAVVVGAGNGAVTFGGTVNGAQALTVNTTGTTTFSGRVGGSTPLASLTTNAGGITVINAAGDAMNPQLTTSGSQIFGDTLTLNQDTWAVTQNAGSTIALNDPVTPINRNGFAYNPNVGGCQGLFGTTTPGAFSTGGCAVLIAPFTVEAAGGNVQFGSTLNGTFALTINNGGTTQFQGAVGNAPGTPLASIEVTSASIELNGGSVTTTGAQTYHSPVTLGAASTLTSTGGGAISFNNIVNGAQALVVNTSGQTNFMGAVSGLTSLTTDAGGTTRVNGGTINAITQTYNDTLTLLSNTTLTGTTGTFSGAINGGNFDLTLDFSGVTTVNGASFANVSNFATGGGGVTELGGTITTALAQTYNDSVTLVADTSLVSTGNAAVTFNSTVISPTTARTLAVNTGGATLFNGQVGGGGNPLASVTTDAPGTTAINGSTVTTTGNQSYNDPVTLGGDTVLASTSSGAISVNSTLQSPGLARTLTVNTAGATVFGGVVGGGGNPLASVATDAPGTTAINGGAVTTGGTQQYGDPVTLGAGTTLTSTGNQLVQFSGTVNGGQNLTVNTAGTTQFNAGVGNSAPLASLTTDAGGTTVVAGLMSTTGTQTYNDLLALGANATLAGTTATFAQTIAGGNNDLTFNLSGATAITPTTFTQVRDITTGVGNYSLSGTIVTGGSMSFGGAVTLVGNTTLQGTSYSVPGTIAGGGNDLTLNFSAVTTVNGATFSNVRDFTTGGGGTTDLNGTVTTTGIQTYNDAVTLGAATTLQSSGNQAIVLNNTVDGAQALTVNTTGAVTFASAVGGTTPLASLQTAVNSTANVGANISTNNGLVNFQGIVNLTAASAISTGNGNINFVGALNGAQALTLNTAGTSTLSGSVGNIVPLASLTTNGGTTQINGGGINAVTQTHNSALALGANTTLTGTTGSFTGGVAGGGRDLTLVFSGGSAISGANFANLANFAVGGGGTTDLAASITANGQAYLNPVTISGATTLASTTAGGITFNGNVDGPQALSVNTAGTTTFAGPVGANSALGSLTTNAGGTAAINGGAITTTGAQNYGGAVTLGGASTTLASTGSDAITLGGGVSGPSALQLNTQGQTSLQGTVSGLASLATDAGGTTAIGTNSIVTTGAQSYQDSVSTAGPTTFTTSSNPVSFSGTLNPGGEVTFNQVSQASIAQAVGALSVTPQGTTITLARAAGDLNLNSPAHSLLVGNLTSGTRINLNSQVNPVATTLSGQTIKQLPGTQLNAPIVSLNAGNFAFDASTPIMGEGFENPIRFGNAVDTVFFAAKQPARLFFAGPASLKDQSRIKAPQSVGAGLQVQLDFDYNGSSAVATQISAVAGEVVGGTVSQVTDQIEESFRPGRIDQTILFGFQGDLSTATPPVLGTIRGVLLPSIEGGSDADSKRKPR